LANTAPFRVRNVRYNTRVVRHPGAPDEHVRTGVKQVDATCVSCGHEWTAQAGVSGLLNMLGGVRLECPRCEAGGTVSQDAYE
jgi:hypothetical protein